MLQMPAGCMSISSYLRVPPRNGRSESQMHDQKVVARNEHPVVSEFSEQSMYELLLLPTSSTSTRIPSNSTSLSAMLLIRMRRDLVHLYDIQFYHLE
jgi:hypothetical protein